MKWFKREKPVWAVLGTAHADSDDDQYPSGEKHAFLIMILCDEDHVEEKTFTLLLSHGWNDVSVERVKRLERPFRSDDPDMLRCYEGATLGNGGVLIYSDPISDSLIN